MQLVPGTVRVQSGGLVVLFTILSCGIYKLFWLYRTTSELRAATGDPTLNAGTDVLLSLVTCGFWGAYAEYRNTQKIHDVLRSRDPGHRDQSQTVLILMVTSVIVGVTWFVASFIVQEEFNALARACDAPYPPPAPPAPGWT